MNTIKTFEVAGTSTLNGKTKVRFANDYVGRLKILFKNGHENVELIELGSKLTKAEICQILMAHERFQTEEQQSAIGEFVVRNIKELPKTEVVATADQVMAQTLRQLGRPRVTAGALQSRAVGLIGHSFATDHEDHVNTTAGRLAQLVRAFRS